MASNQELLDSIQIGVSPITGHVYIGLPDKSDPNTFRIKSDFTERLRKFAPQLFEETTND